jgi:hypothetical protein
MRPPPAGARHHPVTGACTAPRSKLAGRPANPHPAGRHRSPRPGPINVPGTALGFRSKAAGLDVTDGASPGGAGRVPEADARPVRHVSDRARRRSASDRLTASAAGTAPPMRRPAARGRPGHGPRPGPDRPPPRRRGPGIRPRSAHPATRPVTCRPSPRGRRDPSWSMSPAPAARDGTTIGPAPPGRCRAARRDRRRRCGRAGEAPGRGRARVGHCCRAAGIQARRTFLARRYRSELRPPPCERTAGAQGLTACARSRALDGRRRHDPTIA